MRNLRVKCEDRGACTPKSFLPTWLALSTQALTRAVGAGRKHKTKVVFQMSKACTRVKFFWCDVELGPWEIGKIEVEIEKKNEVEIYTIQRQKSRKGRIRQNWGENGSHDISAVSMANT